ncbi:DUF6188 family protein [Streptomyces sp. NPDC056462]|uniref:DUF6188 family protein n=1 Tax=Streptomyces sp. NPDC056462 TaxID=3345826 RepID=UPI00369266CE
MPLGTKPSRRRRPATTPRRCWLKPESQDVAAALVLFGAFVLSAVAFKSGTLRLVFDTGHYLTCSSDLSFEAWQVTGPTGWCFASLPGGDLAVWSGSETSES